MSEDDLTAAGLCMVLGIIGFSVGLGFLLGAAVGWMCFGTMAILTAVGIARNPGTE